MKYALEIKPEIRTGGRRITSQLELERVELSTITEMESYILFMRELIIDKAPEVLLKLCRTNYDIARDSALTLGLDVTNYPKHISPYGIARRFKLSA